MSLRAVVKWIAVSAVAMALIAGLMVSYFLMWPPDAIRPEWRVVVEATFADHRLEVVQKWGSDFYMTRLRVHMPAGVREYVMDGDDLKNWNWDVHILDRNGTVNIYHWSTFRGSYDLRSETFHNFHDVECAPYSLKRGSTAPA